MFLKNIDLTTALRPAYLPDEVLLFVQDNVGLYEGYVLRFSKGGIFFEENAYIHATASSRSRIIRMAQST
jgi:hypothetical protein